MEDTRFERVGGGCDPIHPSVIFGRGVQVGHYVVIDSGVEIGDGAFIGHGTVIRSGVKIGARAIIGHLVVIEANTIIGDDTTIQSQCHITKGALIGNRCFYGPMAMMINTRRISHGRGFKAQLEGPAVGRAARIGAGAIVMPGSKIGDNAVLGAGSILTSGKEVPPREIWFGYPAIHRGRVEEGEVL